MKGVLKVDYESYAKTMKALSDPKRMKILDMLSCGTMCACDVLEHFDFTQPTLSHHIKILVEAGLVTTEKSGTWHHYSINQESAEQLIENTAAVFSPSERCVCITDSNREGESEFEKINSL